MTETIILFLCILGPAGLVAVAITEEDLFDE